MSNIVAITGVSGYIASNIAKKLLDQGYTVHGTVRSTKNKTKVEHLQSLSKKGKLVLFEADLLKEGSFKKCFEGVTYVLHTASPFFFAETKTPYKDLVDPAVKGTENVLRTAYSTSTVKKVVVTSTCGAILGGQPNGHKYVESDWAPVTIKQPYSYSKTLAEKKAWEVTKDVKINTRKVPMVTVNPGLVMGPPQSGRTDSQSMQFFLGLLLGQTKKASESFTFPWVDVRDVTDAHINAMKSDVGGRILTGYAKHISVADAARLMKKLFPKYPVTSEYEGEKTQFELDNAKLLKLLGKKLISFEQSLKDTFKGCLEQNLIPTKK